MPVGSRVRANNAYGSTTDNPLTAGATTFNSAALILLPAITFPTQHSVVVLDPKRVNGQPEIVIVTAHTGLSTSATITRAAYGTTARSHPTGTVWAHIAVDEDYIEILTSTTRPSDPYVGQSIYETDTLSHRYYTGTGWQSAPPIGTLLPYLGSTAPNGYLLADGSAISRTGITADLFAVVGTNYGVGDGATTFNLPNLKGRMPVGRDATQAEFDVLGETGGAKTVTLSATTMPQHSHSITDVQHNHGQTNHDHSIFNPPTQGANGSHYHNIDVTPAGAHTHSIGGNFGFVVGFRTDGAANGHVAGGLERETFTNIDAVGDHDHGTSIDVQSTMQPVTANIQAAFTNLSTTNNAGNTQAHENLQPYITINYIVKI